MIRCESKADQCCQFSDAQYTWENWILRPGDRVHVVHCKDRPTNKPAWQYVLVDEEKLEKFLEQIKTSNINGADYGEVLYSGLGKDPPQEMEDKINKKFCRATNK